MKIATFGAGCFWGTEHLLRSVPGVTGSRVGYMGGSTTAPTYEMVCGSDTGHVEVAQITFDPERISYDDLLRVFWQLHDPISLDDQGPYERGTQYGAVIFYHDDNQGTRAAASKGVYATNRGERPLILVAA